RNGRYPCEIRSLEHWCRSISGSPCPGIARPASRSVRAKPRRACPCAGKSSAGGHRTLRASWKGRPSCGRDIEVWRVGSRFGHCRPHTTSCETWLLRDPDDLTGAWKVDDLAAAAGDHLHQQVWIDGFLEQARGAVGGNGHEPLLELAAELR